MPGIGDGTHHNQNIDDAGHGHCHPSLTLSDELIVFSCSSRKSGAEETDGLRRNATAAEAAGHVRAVMEDRHSWARIDAIIVSRAVVGRYRWSIPQDDFRALAKARRTVSYSPNLMPAMARAHRR